MHYSKSYLILTKGYEPVYRGQYKVKHKFLSLHALDASSLPCALQGARPGVGRPQEGSGKVAADSSAAQLWLVSAGQGSLVRQLCKSGKATRIKEGSAKGHWSAPQGGVLAASPTG